MSLFLSANKKKGGRFKDKRNDASFIELEKKYTITLTKELAVDYSTQDIQQGKIIALLLRRSRKRGL